jgi:hypothetical protein
MVLAIPILMATWFSPILITYHNFGLMKSNKIKLCRCIAFNYSYYTFLAYFIRRLYLVNFFNDYGVYNTWVKCKCSDVLRSDIFMYVGLSSLYFNIIFFSIYNL